MFVGEKYLKSSKITKTTDQFEKNAGWMEIENVSFDFFKLSFLIL